MLKYIEEINELIKSKKALEAYNEKNFLVKLFCTKPVLTTSKTPDEIAKTAVRQYPRADYVDENGEYAEVYVNYASDCYKDKYYPVVIYKAYIDNCYFMCRQHILSTGDSEEWGIQYPFSECGVTGLYSERNKHLSNIDENFINIEKKFLQLVENIKKEVKNA